MGNNANLKPWPKGVSGNPGGRPKRELTPENVGGIVEKYLLMAQGELQAIYADKTTPAINALAAGACLDAIKLKKWDLANSMLDRSIGKVKDVVENHNHSHDDEFNSAPRGELVDILRRANAKRPG